MKHVGCVHRTPTHFLIGSLAKRRLLWLPMFSAMMAFLFVAAPVSHAQLKTSASFVKVSTQLSADKVQAGESLQATLILDITNGWHVQSSKPSRDDLIATRFVAQAESGITVGAISYPTPKTIDFNQGKLDVFEGKAPIQFTIKLSAGVPSGRHVLRGKLTVQACDDKTCFAPSKIDVEIPFEVVSADTSTKAINSERFSTPPSAVSGPRSTDNGEPSSEVARLFQERGALFAFVGIFLIGLLLNLTPCVYPMLAVTVSIFGGQSDTNAARVFAKALVYVIGIATMYSVLGCVAAFGGKLFGAWLQNPWVLAGIAALFVVLALSMFGLFEIRPPSALMNKLGATTAAGFAGIYVSGLIVGIFAAPCVGPPVIGLLVEVGKRGDPWFGFLSFFVLSLGLGAPYLVLGTFSGLLKKLPKSGVWMEWVKKVFGVILLGVAAFYLSLAFAPELLRWIPALTLLVGGVYLGFVDRSGQEKKTFRNVKWAVGGLAALAGLFLLMSEPKTTLTWEPYHADKLAAAKAAGTPAILDFYADWCIPCHELDRRTYTDPAVIRALQNHVRLKVDLTRYESPESEAVRRQFNIQGVPTVILLDPDGNEIADTRIIGFVPSEEFLQQTKLKSP